MDSWSFHRATSARLRLESDAWSSCQVRSDKKSSRNALTTSNFIFRHSRLLRNDPQACRMADSTLSAIQHFLLEALPLHTEPRREGRITNQLAKSIHSIQNENCNLKSHTRRMYTNLPESSASFRIF